MLDTPQTITSPVTLLVTAANGEAEIAAELRYEPSDPFAVSLVIGTGHADPVTWVFARELLHDGLTAPTGRGDITIEPAGRRLGERVLRITLATDCLATMLMSADAATEFLMASFALVPTGCELEHIDIDAEINALLA